MRTLEDHGLAVRNSAGELELGARLAALASNVSRDLQSAARPELTALAEEWGMTAFVATLDATRTEAVTLASVEPRHADAVVAQRPGTRHSIEIGAPGRAIRNQLQSSPVSRRFETSHDEVFVGLSSVAVPLAVHGQPPASLAVVFLTHPVDVAAIADRLEGAARAISDALS